MKKNILFLAVLLMSCKGAPQKEKVGNDSIENEDTVTALMGQEATEAEVAEFVPLPDHAEKKDEVADRILYLVTEKETDEECYSVWLKNKKTSEVKCLFRTNSTGDTKWDLMADGNGIAVSADEITVGYCYKCMFLPWNKDKVYIEGCPDGRNVWSYVFDIKSGTAIQFPSTEGLISMDSGSKLLHMGLYGYHPEGGRYSVERVYTENGAFTGDEIERGDE